MTSTSGLLRILDLEMKYLSYSLGFNKFYLFLLISIFLSGKAESQSIDLIKEKWPAFWITVPGSDEDDYGVYLFRKNLELQTAPTTFVIHTSGDNRYKLYVNEKLVSLGPAKGDVAHWRYETLDIAPYLKIGKNIIAAKVWNEGSYKPLAHNSLRTGIIIQGNSKEEEIINTNNSWKCIEDPSYLPLKVHIPNTYYVAGPGEFIDMQKHIHNWNNKNFDDLSWEQAKEQSSGVPKGIVAPFVSTSNWLLVPSTLPPMELSLQRLVETRISTGVEVPDNFPLNKERVQVPSNTTATILLDQSFLTNSYPTLIFSGGRGSAISLGYAEALYSDFPEKGNRNIIEGKNFEGRKDSLISEGSERQIFTSVNWRTYRYIQLEIKTQNDPLVIEDIFGTFTGYPFELNAVLNVPENKEIDKILEIGWRTARLCAVDTYMDTPYYEQLQYIGDTRIQALVSLFNSGDDRLVKNALTQMDNSREPEGVTDSRHPSNRKQKIPPFSLWYIGMLHDYWMYGEDTEFVKDKLPGERQVLNYFRTYQQDDGSLKDVPYWSFTDWVVSDGWSSGVAPSGVDGNSAAYDLQLLWAYQLAAEMEEEMGLGDYATLYKKYAGQLKKTIQEKYWDDTRSMFADRLERDLFSQHVNSLAILTDMVSGSEAKQLGEKLLSEEDLAPASIYFKYYLHQALVKAGLGNGYLDWLDIWRENIALGLTTWAEKSEVETSRSDSHAWGSSPNIEFFRTVLGIDSDAPGFSKIKIKPHLGDIKEISGEVPHPKGKIAAGYKLEGDVWKIKLSLPSETTGYFLWKDKRYDLVQGVNEFEL